MMIGDNIVKASEIIKKGGIVIFPTDTAYAIGCSVFNIKAVEKLFSLRRRPDNQATPVLVNSVFMAQSLLFRIPHDVREKLIKPYWPGALTIILNCRTDKVPSMVRGHGSTLGVRMPNNKIALWLIKGSGVPILGPSANFHGEKTPYSFDDLDRNLIGLADYALKGECDIKQPSTVVNCTKHPWEIVRQGPVKLDI